LKYEKPHPIFSKICKIFNPQGKSQILTNLGGDVMGGGRCLTYKEQVKTSFSSFKINNNNKI